MVVVVFWLVGIWLAVSRFLPENVDWTKGLPRTAMCTYHGATDFPEPGFVNISNPKHVVHKSFLRFQGEQELNTCGGKVLRTLKSEYSTAGQFGLGYVSWLSWMKGGDRTKSMDDYEVFNYLNAIMQKTNDSDVSQRLDLRALAKSYNVSSGGFDVTQPVDSVPIWLGVTFVEWLLIFFVVFVIVGIRGSSSGRGYFQLWKREMVGAMETALGWLRTRCLLFAGSREDSASDDEHVFVGPIATPDAAGPKSALDGAVGSHLDEGLGSVVDGSGGVAVNGGVSDVSCALESDVALSTVVALAPLVTSPTVTVEVGKITCMMGFISVAVCFVLHCAWVVSLLAIFFLLAFAYYLWLVAVVHWWVMPQYVFAHFRLWLERGWLTAIVGFILVVAWILSLYPLDLEYYINSVAVANMVRDKTETSRGAYVVLLFDKDESVGVPGYVGPDSVAEARARQKVVDVARELYKNTVGFVADYEFLDSTYRFAWKLGNDYAKVLVWAGFYLLVRVIVSWWFGSGRVRKVHEIGTHQTIAGVGKLTRVAAPGADAKTLEAYKSGVGSSAFCLNAVIGDLWQWGLVPSIKSGGHSHLTLHVPKGANLGDCGCLRNGGRTGQCRAMNVPVAQALQSIAGDDSTGFDLVVVHLSPTRWYHFNTLRVCVNFLTWLIFGVRVLKEGSMYRGRVSMMGEVPLKPPVVAEVVKPKVEPIELGETRGHSMLEARRRLQWELDELDHELWKQGRCKPLGYRNAWSESGEADGEALFKYPCGTPSFCGVYGDGVARPQYMVGGHIQRFDMRHLQDIVRSNEESHVEAAALYADVKERRKAPEQAVTESEAPPFQLQVRPPYEGKTEARALGKGVSGQVLVSQMAGPRAQEQVDSLLENIGKASLNETSQRSKIINNQMRELEDISKLFDAGYERIVNAQRVEDRVRKMEESEMGRQIAALAERNAYLEEHVLGVSRRADELLVELEKRETEKRNQNAQKLSFEAQMKEQEVKLRRLELELTNQRGLLEMEAEPRQPPVAVSPHAPKPKAKVGKSKGTSVKPTVAVSPSEAAVSGSVPLPNGVAAAFVARVVPGGGTFGHYEANGYLLRRDDGFYFITHLHVAGKEGDEPTPYAFRGWVTGELFQHGYKDSHVVKLINPKCNIYMPDRIVWKVELDDGDVLPYASGVVNTRRVSRGEVVTLTYFDFQSLMWSSLAGTVKEIVTRSRFREVQKGQVLSKKDPDSSPVMYGHRYATYDISTKAGCCRGVVFARDGCVVGGHRFAQCYDGYPGFEMDDHTLHGMVDHGKSPKYLSDNNALDYHCPGKHGWEPVRGPGKTGAHVQKSHSVVTKREAVQYVSCVVGRADLNYGAWLARSPCGVNKVGVCFDCKLWAHDRAVAEEVIDVGSGVRRVPNHISGPVRHPGCACVDLMRVPCRTYGEASADQLYGWERADAEGVARKCRQKWGDAGQRACAHVAMYNPGWCSALSLGYGDRCVECRLGIDAMVHRKVMDGDVSACQCRLCSFVVKYGCCGDRNGSRFYLWVDGVVQLRGRPLVATREACEALRPVDRIKLLTLITPDCLWHHLRKVSGLRPIGDLDTLGFELLSAMVATMVGGRVHGDGPNEFQRLASILDLFFPQFGVNDQVRQAFAVSRGRGFEQWMVGVAERTNVAVSEGGVPSDVSRVNATLVPTVDVRCQQVVTEGVVNPFTCTGLLPPCERGKLVCIATPIPAWLKQVPLCQVEEPKEPAAIPVQEERVPPSLVEVQPEVAVSPPSRDGGPVTECTLMECPGSCGCWVSGTSQERIDRFCDADMGRMLCALYRDTVARTGLTLQQVKRKCAKSCCEENRFWLLVNMHRDAAAKKSTGEYKAWKCMCNFCSFVVDGPMIMTCECEREDGTRMRSQGVVTRPSFSYPRALRGVVFVTEDHRFVHEMISPAQVTATPPQSFRTLQQAKECVVQHVQDTGVDKAVAEYIHFVVDGVVYAVGDRLPHSRKVNGQLVIQFCYIARTDRTQDTMGVKTWTREYDGKVGGEGFEELTFEGFEPYGVFERLGQVTQEKLASIGYLRTSLVTDLLAFMTEGQGLRRRIKSQGAMGSINGRFRAPRELTLKGAVQAKYLVGKPNLDVLRAEIEKFGEPAPFNPHREHLAKAWNYVIEEDKALGGFAPFLRPTLPMMREFIRANFKNATSVEENVFVEDGRGRSPSAGSMLPNGTHADVFNLIRNEVPGHDPCEVLADWVLGAIDALERGEDGTGEHDHLLLKQNWRWLVVGKDDRYSFKKVREGVGRSIQMPSLALKVLHKWCFGISDQYWLRGLHYRVGEDMDMPVRGELLDKYMKAKGCISTDITGWDRKLPRELMLTYFDEYLPNFCPLLPPAILQHMRDVTINSLLVMPNGETWQKLRGNPSGYMNTLRINTVILRVLDTAFAMEATGLSAKALEKERFFEGCGDDCRVHWYSEVGKRSCVGKGEKGYEWLWATRTGWQVKEEGMIEYVDEVDFKQKCHGSPPFVSRSMFWYEEEGVLLTPLHDVDRLLSKLLFESPVPDSARVVGISVCMAQWFYLHNKGLVVVPGVDFLYENHPGLVPLDLLDHLFEYRLRKDAKPFEGAATYDANWRSEGGHGKGFNANKPRMIARLGMMRRTRANKGYSSSEVHMMGVLCGYYMEQAGVRAEDSQGALRVWHEAFNDILIACGEDRGCGRGDYAANYAYAAEEANRRVAAYLERMGLAEDDWVDDMDFDVPFDEFKREPSNTTSWGDRRGGDR